MNSGGSGPGKGSNSATQPISGIAVVDKPSGWTSHDVVGKCRGILGTRKVGHAGTLDPAATGVLVLGVGKATRLLRFLTGLRKTYVGEIEFGTETNTLDAQGEVVAIHEMAEITNEEVRGAARDFVGKILQVPPMVSAVKVGGKRLHELARKGMEIDRPAREVEVFRFDLEPVEGAPPGGTPLEGTPLGEASPGGTPLGGAPLVWSISAEVSSGTFIRSLASDLGKALGGGAHLRSLRRTSVGSFGIDQATTMEDITLRPIADAVVHLEKLVADEGQARRICFGQPFLKGELGEADDGPGPWAVFGLKGDLLAVYSRVADRLKPLLVLAEPHAKPQALA